jgi:hypothetical protein
VIVLTLVRDAADLLKDRRDAGDLNDTELVGAFRELTTMWELAGDPDLHSLTDPQHPFWHNHERINALSPRSSLLSPA